jgi:hypothetical protein
MAHLTPMTTMLPNVIRMSWMTTRGAAACDPTVLDPALRESVPCVCS